MTQTDDRIKVFAIGCRGSGKTMFLSGLARLARGDSASRFHLIPDDSRTSTLFADLVAYADARTWPPPTSDELKLDCRVAYDSERQGQLEVGLSLIEYPGEELMESSTTLDFEQRQLLAEAFNDAQILLLLVDPTQELQGNAAIHERDTVRARQDLLVRAINQICKGGSQGSRIKKHVAIVLTKADLFDTKNPATWQQIQHDNDGFLRRLEAWSASRCKTFWVSSAGGTQLDGDVRIPDPDASPTGYDKLFSWVEGQASAISDPKRKLRMLAVFAVPVVLLIVLVGSMVFDGWRERDLADRIRSAPIQQLGQLELSSDRQRNAWDDRVLEEITEVEEILNRIPAPSTQVLQQLSDKLAMIADGPDSRYASDLEEAKAEVLRPLQKGMFGAIEASRQSIDRAETLRLCSEFLSRFPQGALAERVREIAQLVGTGQRDDFKDSMRAPVTSREGLRQRAANIGEYLEKWGSEETTQAQAQMDKARELAIRLSSSPRVRLSPSIAGFNPERPQRKLKLTIDAGGQKHEYDSGGKVHTATFGPGKKITLEATPQWPSVNISINLTDGNILTYDGKNDAEQKFHIIKNLARVKRFELKDLGEWNKSAWGQLGAYVKLEIEIEDQVNGWRQLDTNEIDAYGKFINPATGW